MPFTLNISDIKHGTAIVHISADDQHITLFPSYLSDGLGDLACITATLLEGPLEIKATCVWQDEPGEWRWVYRQDNPETVCIEILRFTASFSPQCDEEGDLIFRTNSSPMRLATQIKGQLHQWLNEYGEQGYREQWGYPFPSDAFQRLEAIIQSRKNRGLAETSASSGSF